MLLEQVSGIHIRTESGVLGLETAVICERRASLLTEHGY